MNLTIENKGQYKSNVFKTQEVKNKSQLRLNEATQSFLKLQEEFAYWNWLYQKYKREDLIQKEKSLNQKRKEILNNIESLKNEQEQEIESLKKLMRSEIPEQENENISNFSSLDDQMNFLKNEFETLNKIKTQLTQEIDSLKNQNPQFTNIYFQCHQVLLRAFNEREDQENSIRTEISKFMLNQESPIEENEEKNEGLASLHLENEKLEEEIEEWRRELWILEKAIWKKKEGFCTEEEAEKEIQKVIEEAEGYKNYLQTKLRELKGKKKASSKPKSSTVSPIKGSNVKTSLSKFLKLSAEKPQQEKLSNSPYMKEFEQFFERTRLAT